MKIAAEGGWKTTICRTSSVLAVVFSLSCAGSPVDRFTRASSFPELSNPLANGTEFGFFNDPGAFPREILASDSSVWAALPTVHLRLGIPSNIRDSRNRIFGATHANLGSIEGRPLSRYLDCGRTKGLANANQFSVNITATTKLRPNGAGRTVVETTVRGIANARSDRTVFESCSSNGTLELRLAQLIVEVLSSGVVADAL
ncbi:MAG: hypothetical protein OEY63_06430 [Gemmatimonadota bacterium]|nr:hypothetical protein [Gemmatimonadota bacterium]MDH5805982.1 hypothetical protein [Gemmatimonadota bacterium]